MNEILLSILGTLATALLGVIAKANIAIYNKQSEQTTKIAEMSLKVDGVIKRTDSLHEWRNNLQEEQIENYKKIIQDLRDKEK